MYIVVQKPSVSHAINSCHFFNLAKEVETEIECVCVCVARIKIVQTFVHI